MATLQDLVLYGVREQLHGSEFGPTYGEMPVYIGSDVEIEGIDQWDGVYEFQPGSKEWPPERYFVESGALAYAEASYTGEPTVALFWCNDVRPYKGWVPFLINYRAITNGVSIEEPYYSFVLYDPNTHRCEIVKFHWVSGDDWSVASTFFVLPK